MNRTQIENYMSTLETMGRVMAQLSPPERRKLFAQHYDTQPDYISSQFHVRGLKGTFGITDAHREKVSIALKASWAKRKAQSAALQALNHLGDNMTALTTPDQIATFRLATLRSALRLETKGMKASRGPSAYSILRKDYGYKGTRDAVLAQVTADVAALMSQMEQNDEKGTVIPAN